MRRRWPFIVVGIIVLAVPCLAAITSLDDYIGSNKQLFTWCKTGTRTTVAAINFTVFDLAGNPGAGTLAIGNTAAGTVPTDATTGYPVINAFGGGATGYITRVLYGSTVACRLTLYDRLFAAGAYTYNADTTLASQPSYSSRVPGSGYGGLQLWVEAVTAFTGTPSFQINYLDQDGNAGDTGVVSGGAALTVGRCVQIPLAAGDYGIQRIDRVRGTVATAGTFNVMVLRPLWTGRVPSAGAGDVHNLTRTGMIQVYEDSALYMLVAADSTSSGVPEVQIEVSNK
jgi:hypothetical protein